MCITGLKVDLPEMSISQEVYSSPGCVPGGDSFVFFRVTVGKMVLKGVFQMVF